MSLVNVPLCNSSVIVRYLWVIFVNVKFNFCFFSEYIDELRWLIEYTGDAACYEERIFTFYHDMGYELPRPRGRPLVFTRAGALVFYFVLFFLRTLQRLEILWALQEPKDLFNLW